MFPLFQKNLKPQVIGKRCYLPPLPFKISLRDTSFHICLNSLGFYLSPECLLNFFLIWYSSINVGKFFQFMVFTFLENALNLCIFTHAPALHSKLQVGFFENLFPPKWKGWRKLWFALSKLVYLYFVWFVIFLNVMALQFCE